MDKIYIATDERDESIIGAYSTPEKALERCRWASRRSSEVMPEPDFKCRMNGELRLWYSMLWNDLYYTVEELLIDDGG